MAEAKEARFHAKLFDKLDDYVENNDTKFESVSIEENTGGGSADIYLESHHTAGLVIEVKRDNKEPTRTKHIRQARDYAEEKNAELFATCNSNDFFLFNYMKVRDKVVEAHEIEREYVNLKDFNVRSEDMGGFIPMLFDMIDGMFRGEDVSRGKINNILGELRSYHNVAWPIYKTILEEKYGSNAIFEEKFDEWVDKNDYGNKSRDKQFRVASKQYAYLLVNRIIFYNVIRDKVVNGDIVIEEDVSLDPLHEGLQPQGIKDRVTYKFEQIVDKIDYEPIFHEREDSLFNLFPENQKTQYTLYVLIDNIRHYEVMEIGEDFLGTLYEELIPEKERKELGQYYTPPVLAETISKWCVRKWRKNNESIPKMLDPASGSGTFPVELYKQISENYDNSEHMDIVSNLEYVDINRFPLHLTGLNLASMNPSKKTKEVKSNHSSFFDTHLSETDIVVGNPPYISSNQLYPDKNHFRNHLEENFEGQYINNREKRFSKRCDAYIYFITKAVAEMNNGGLLGFVIPTKWMTAGYGEGIKRFLYENAKIHHIVTYDSRAFEDAQVTTCLLMIEKCSDDEVRNQNNVRFTRLFRSITSDDLYTNIEKYELEPRKDVVSSKRLENARMLSIKQKNIFERPDEKIEYYTRTPSDIIDTIFKSDRTNMLLEVASMERGITTGANDFFIMSQDDIESWSLDKNSNYLKPALTSKEDAAEHNRWIITLDNLIGDCGNEREAKTRLQNMGYNNLVEYIEFAESNGMNKGRTCRRRDIWFNLGDMTVSRPILPKGMHEDVGCIDNYDGKIPKDRFYTLESDYSDDFIMAILDSVITKISLESIGRREGGGILELLKEDWCQIRIPNPSLISDKYKVINMYEEGNIDAMNKYILDEIDINPEQYQYYQRVRQVLTESRVGRGESVESLLTSD